MTCDVSFSLFLSLSKRRGTKEGGIRLRSRVLLWIFGFTGTRRTGNSPLISDGFRAIRKETFVQRVVSRFSTCRCWCSASIKDGKARCDIVVCGLAYQSPTFLFFILSFSFFVFASMLFLLFPFFSFLFLRLKRI